jgi:hypothetical protein
MNLKSPFSKLRGSRPAVSEEAMMTVIRSSGSTTLGDPPSGDELLRQVEFLETELAEARQHPDLSHISEGDLAVMASETARKILEVARSQGEASVVQAEIMVREAKEQAEQIVEETRKYAKEKLTSAMEEASAVLENANKEIAQSRAELATESEDLRKSVIDEIKEIRERAEFEARRIKAQAIARREALYREIHQQRDSMLVALEDAANIQKMFTEGYLHMRKAIDESVANLVMPVQMAKHQLHHLNQELENDDGGESLGLI